MSTGGGAVGLRGTSKFFFVFWIYKAEVIGNDKAGATYLKQLHTFKTASPSLNFITIFQCDLLNYDAPNLRLRVRCSKGTYVRSLVHDIGEKLDCGAHLAELRRTSSGNFSVDRAVPLDTLLQEPALLKQYLVPLEKAIGNDIDK